MVGHFVAGAPAAIDPVDWRVLWTIQAESSPAVQLGRRVRVEVAWTGSKESVRCSSSVDMVSGMVYSDVEELDIVKRLEELLRAR